MESTSAVAKAQEPCGEQDFSGTPRILVVAEFGPGSPGGSWIILKQLLRGLDWNQIYWWSLFGRKDSSHLFGGRHHGCNIPTRLAPNQSLRALRAGIMENIVAPYAARDLLAHVESVHPQFILFLAHRWGIPIFRRVMPRLKVPWHLSLHDMPDTAGFSENLGSRRAVRFMGYTEELYRAASSRDVISLAMAADMEARTGVACSNIFRCAVEPEVLAQLALAAAVPADETIRIGYAGTIIAEPVFAAIVKALRAVRERFNRPVEIHLYSWHSYQGREWFDPSVVIEHGPKPESEIHQEYRRLTWGLAIMHLDDDDPRYNRLSFPCKFTASLAAGLPLICMGNSRSALVELARSYQVGLLFTEKDVATLAEQLGQGLFEFSRFPAYRSEIARCAETEFNAGRNRRKLHEIMRAVKS